MEDRKLTPTFIRTRGIDENLIPAIVQVLNKFKWEKVGIVFQKIAKYTEIKDLLLSELQRLGFPTPYLVGIKPYQSLKNDSFVVETFSDIKKHAKSR